jgi:hypothetical protein
MHTLGKRSLGEPWWQNIALSLSLVLSGLLFVPILRGYWLADDFWWVRDSLNYNWREMPRLFLGYWPQLNEFRPLWSVSFITDLLIWGPDPRGLHLTNIIFHVVASVLVWSLVIVTVQDHGLAALLSLAFFVLHPIHPEPVAWISARGHVLVTVFILSSMIFLQRFHMFGGVGNYISSFGAAVAAFATQEAAVALPFLLLSKDLLYTSKPDRQRLVRILKLHWPFWALLGSYLVLRILMFGRLGRDGMITTSQQLLYHIYQSTRILWLSPFSLPDMPDLLAERGLHWLLFLLITILLLAPFTFLRLQKLEDYIRDFVYFAIGWPIITTCVYLGERSERHLYLASIGPCVVLGLATVRLLASRRPFLILYGSTAALLLFLVYGWTLANGVSGFALNGERSFQIHQEVDLAIERASQDINAIVIVIPEIPGNHHVFWEYFYPVALQPPFTHSIPSVPVLSSFASIYCVPNEWISYHKDSLTRLAHGVTGPVYIVEWDTQHIRFVTHKLSQEDFKREGYLASDGPLLRSCWPGGERIVLP